MLRFQWQNKTKVYFSLEKTSSDLVILQSKFIPCSNCSFRLSHNYISTVSSPPQALYRESGKRPDIGFMCLSLKVTQSPAFSHINSGGFKLTAINSGKCKALKYLVSILCLYHNLAVQVLNMSLLPFSPTQSFPKEKRKK